MMIDHVEVTIDGVVIPPNNYTFDGTSITFDDPTFVKPGEIVRFTVRSHEGPKFGDVGTVNDSSGPIKFMYVAPHEIKGAADHGVFWGLILSGMSMNTGALLGPGGFGLVNKRDVEWLNEP